MIQLKFSPQEMLAEATNNVLKAYMIANGSDEQTAILFGATVSGAIKGIGIEKRQTVLHGIDAAIKKAWSEILSKEEFESLDDACKTDLKQNVITSQNVFESLTTDKPINTLRTKIITIFRKHTDLEVTALNEYARFMSEQLLISINKEIESDEILTLIKEIEKLRSDVLIRQDTTESILLACFENIIKKLDNISESVISVKGLPVNQTSIPELFWNAGKAWYEDSRKPGARFHSLEIVRNILPSATDKPIKPAESEFNFPFRASDTDNHNIQCSRFSELLQDKNSLYHRGHYMLIGEGGIGKTTTLMSVMYDVYDKKECYKGESVIPLFIELSLSPDSQDSHAYDGTSSSVIHRLIYTMLHLRDSKKDRSDFLRECMNDESSIAKDNIRELLYSQKDKGIKYALLIDGLNEVSAEAFSGNRSSSAQGRILHEIEEMINDYANVTIILTSRNSAFIEHPSFHSFYIRGLKWEEIEQYLREKGKKDAEIQSIRTSDSNLNNILSIPMFLTMYVLLHNTKSITTRGELMKVFFHERIERRKREYEIQRQGDIAERIDHDEEQSVTGTMRRGKITLPMQWMFIDILIPEIAAKMKEEQGFQISDKAVRSILESLFVNQDSLYCGRYRKFSNRCFEEQLQGEDLDIVISDFMETYKQKASKYTNAFLRFCESSMGILYKGGGKNYGFIHQHFRDYFAAVCYVNRMKTAYMAFLEKEVDMARNILSMFDEAPVDPILMTYIGEYLGEHHNAPAPVGNIEIFNPEQELTEEDLYNRHLLSGILDIYRGVKFENKYCIYNLIEIIKRARKDLSGADFHNLDLRQCRFYKVSMDTQQGIDFSNALIDAGSWFAEGHTDWVTSACFSPDGRRIVTASLDNSARVWDAYTGNLILTLEGHTNRVTSACFSPDGKHIATSSDDETAVVWDAYTGNPVYTLNIFLNSVCFSHDGKRIVTSSYKNVQVWDASTGEPIRRLDAYDGNITSALFSPDGRRIITKTMWGKDAKIWDAFTGNLILTLKGHTERLTTASFSRDGNRIITSSFDRTARIWDAYTGGPILTINNKSGIITSACFSKDGCRIVTSSSDGSARVWDAYTGSLILTLEGHVKLLTSAYFVQGGACIVTYSDDGSMRLWSSFTGRLVYAPKEMAVSWVTRICFSRDGRRFVAIIDENNVAVYDRSSVKIEHILFGHTSKITSASFSYDGSRIVTSSWDESARVWDTNTGDLLHVLKGHTGEVTSARFSRDGNRIVTSSWDGSARVWDTNTGDLLHVLKGHTGEVTSARFSRDGNRIVTSSWDRSARVWDTNTGDLLHILKGHTSIVSSARFSRDGNRIVTSSWDGSARVWDTNTGNLLHILEGHTGDVTSAHFSPDRNLIVTSCDDGSTWLWNAQNGKLIYRLYGVIGLHISGIDFNNIDSRSKVSDTQKEIFRQYGAIVG